VRVYHGQLRELLTQYGKLHELWFDGANGGDGYTVARETRRTDAGEPLRSIVASVPAA
jgi:alpha-L-fucosidase